MTVKFWIRDERIVKLFNNHVKKNREKLLEEGWDIGRRRISLLKNSINISVVPDSKSPYIEITFMFLLSENTTDDIERKNKMLEKVVNEFIKDVPKAKISIDISYSVSKYLDVSLNKIKDKICQNNFEENKMNALTFRKFEKINKRNVTTKIALKDDKTSVVLDFEVRVENIIANDNRDNMFNEIVKSVYFYHNQYRILHSIITGK